jgi:hypothetical protein
MSATSPTVLKAITGTCPFCGHEYLGTLSHCGRCGTLQESAREEIKAQGKEARKHLRFQRASSDLFFLVGLLLGGPMMTLGGEVRLGLFLVLAGGFASALRRYTEWSTPGTLGIGTLSATLVATLAMGSGEDEGVGTEVGVEARDAFVQALDAEELDVMIETRGLGAVTVWFRPPQDTLGECGTYPAVEVRDHLGALGFKRVVVVDPKETGGMCSFRP